MFNEQNISDYRLQSTLQNFLQNHPKKFLLPNLYKCGQGVLKMPGTMPAVFILKNQENRTKTYGTLTCRSAWACPKCTANVMAKKATDIACLIDALIKQQQRYACMITFTMPHIKTMTCDETFTILRETWRAFTHFVKRRIKKYVLKNDLGERSKKGGALGVGKKGTTKEYKINRSPYASFREDLDIQHIVRVYEFTWGENSWHPHIHALFWVPKDKFNQITDYEETLNQFWWKCLEKIITKKSGEELAKRLCSKGRKTHNSVTISKTPEGKPRIQKSSYYVAGWQGSKWSADKELTRLDDKTTKDGHYSPFKILEMAQEEFAKKNYEKYEEWANLFVEYALATVKHRRCNFSPNCGKIIREWKKTNTYLEIVKKKLTQRIQENWKVVYWFHEEQWLKICFLEKMSPHKHLRSDILDKLRCMTTDEFEFYLQTIDPELVNPMKHMHQKWIEQQIFGGIDKDVQIA